VQVSASPLDSTTTAFEGLDFSNDPIDPVVFERTGYNNVFALWNVNATHVGVDIYAGGRDLAMVSVLCFFGTSLFATVLVWGCWKPKSYALAMASVALLLTIVVVAVATRSGLDHPMFTFAVKR
jgi:hypothetical protein